MVIIVVAFYLLLFLYEYVPLRRQKLNKDLIVNSALTVLSFTAAVLLALNIKIPSPAKPIEAVIISIFGR